MTKVLYEELRPREFEARLTQAPIAYLPLGTLEWHGLHLPLGADGLQSKGLFCEVARRIGGVVLPMLFLGPDRILHEGDATYYGMDFCYRPDGKPNRQLPGSAYHVSDKMYDRILDSVMAQLARAGFRIVVGHGHGPSNKAFRRNVPVMKEKYGLTLVSAIFDGAKYGYQSDHAAANETSILMHLRPELVDMTELPADLNETPEAVAGDDPRTHASAEMGLAALNETADYLVDTLTQLLKSL